MRVTFLKVRPPHFSLPDEIRENQEDRRWCRPLLPSY